MKYYVYISDAKVNMLIPQILRGIKGTASTEFKVDLKIFSLSKKTEVEDDRIGKLEAVCDFIQEYGNVGTVENPDEYIFNVMPMRMVVSMSRDFVYWSGKSKQTVVVLGGTASHLIGSTAPSGNRLGKSLLPILVQMMEELVTNDNQLSKRKKRAGEENRYYGLRKFHAAAEATSGPVTKMEFLAKKLAFGQVEADDGSENVLIATPLYVAMAE